MPTFETLPRFTADIQYLAPAQRRRFRRVALGAFVPGVPELTWSMGTGPAGRARSLARFPPGHPALSRRRAWMTRLPAVSRRGPGAACSAGT